MATTTSSAYLGSDYLITFYSSRDDVSVTVEVTEVDTSVKTPLTLSLRTDLSAPQAHVFAETFRPTRVGWYVVQYRVEDNTGYHVHSSTTRFHVEAASSGSGGGGGGGSVSAGDGVASAPNSEGGSVVQTPVILNGSLGTISFSVGRK